RTDVPWRSARIKIMIKIRIKTEVRKIAAMLGIVGWNALMAPVASAAQVILVAGGGSNTNTAVPLKATEARLNGPFGVDFDFAGNLYIVEMTGNRVRKLDGNGMLTVIAGTGEKGAKDGPGLTAQFNGPHNLAISA